MRLSIGEFEVLQAVVRNGRANEAWLTDNVLLPKVNIQKSISSLMRKELVRSKKNQILPNKKNALAVLEPYRVKRAVILAGGLGMRMRPETETVPKPMVLVGNKRIIETQIDALLEAGISEIIIIRGYLGEVFDVLRNSYPDISFIDTPHFDLDSTLHSVSLAVDLLENAYFIEGDLYINDPTTIRPYEYQSSYCGVASNFDEDWYFCTDKDSIIRQHGHGRTYKFVGILYFAPREARQLKKDIAKILQDNNRYHKFIESIPFDQKSGNYKIVTRPIQEFAVTEIDTYEELLALRQAKQ